MNEIPPSSMLADLADEIRTGDGTLRGPSSAEPGVVAELLSLASKEIEYRHLIVETRRRSLLDAIETTADLLTDADDREGILETLETACYDVRTASGSATEIEAAFAEVASEILAELNDLPPARRREARQPMYDHLQRRTDVYLDVLGYSSVSERTWEIT